MGKKPDRSLITDLLGDEDVAIIPIMRGNTRRPQSTPSKSRKPKADKPKAKTAKEIFLDKVEREMFHEFEKKDWLQYFILKAEEQGIKYLPGNHAKEYSIIAKLMQQLHYPDIKRMIDFIFESDQDIMDKRTAGVYLLSGGWTNTIYQNSILWENGEYVPKSEKWKKEKAPSRQREWVASRKDADGPGISYGKPIREEAEAKKASKPIVKRKRVRL